jgi:hypothetical protein
MGTPWGWIQAKKQADEYSGEINVLKKRIDKFLKLLKMDNPDIQQAIRVLEEKED